MKKHAQCLRALTWLALAVAPGLANAQGWQWASAPSAISDPAPAGASGGSVIVATAPDGAGNTVVAGNFSGRFTLGVTTLVSAGYTDVFVARLSPRGEWLQAVRAGGPSEDFASGLQLDVAGNVVVVGGFGNLVSGATATFGAVVLASAGNADAFVARLSPGGQWTQAVRAGGPGNDGAHALALDAAGNAVVAGSFQGSAGFGSTTLAADGVTTAAFVARLNLDAGTWSQASQSTCAFGTVPFRTLVSAVALDGAGNVVLTGQFDASTRFGALALSNPLGGTSAYLARLSAGGQWTQAVQLATTTRNAPPPAINALAVDGAGTATVAGILLETVAFGPTTLTSTGGYDVFVARLDAAGQWTQAVRAGGPANDIVRALAVDALGNATVAGLFGVYGGAGQSTTATFGSLALSSSGGMYDVFMARLNAAGQWTQAVRAGGAGNDEANALSLDAEGSITVAGACGSPAGFGGIVLSGTTGYPMAYVARFASTALATRSSAPAEAFALAPNPAAGLVYLSWPDASAAARPVQLLDALGREVRRQLLPARTRAATLDVAGLAPGLYVVRCGSAASRLRVE